MDIYSNYHNYLNTNLSGLRITHREVMKEIESLDKVIFKVTLIGKSENSKDINLIKFGNGQIKILMWTQMHGDESTATKSIFDLFNFVNLEKFTNVINTILNSCTIYVIPMLNPDGSDLYTRENFLKNDLNRDAKTLKNSESRILIEQLQKIKPDYAFNLHDQTSYYNVQGSNKVATISLLSPAADESRTLTESRKKAMSVIATMNEVLQKFIPEGVGRYNDAYCENCFGDTIQSLDRPTILVESGYYPGDEEREITRKLHTVLLLESLKRIAEGNLPSYEKYFDIPVNEKRFYDKKIENVLYKGQLTSVGVRYKYIFREGMMKKIVDENETICENDLIDKLFHEVIDANGGEFNNYC